MNLTLDIGNTRMKWARFEGRELMESGSFPVLDWNSANDLVLRHASDTLTISSVVHLPEQFYAICKDRKALIIDHTTPIPVTNNYSTPSTLGMDRLCAAIGAKGQFPDHPVIVVDIGTCIKFEFVTAQGVYEGGNISPGLRMRFASLHAYTSKLPDLEPEKVGGPIGKTTNEALRLGVQQGMLFEIEAMISTMQSLHPNLKTVATGGDLPFFVNDLKTHIFADLLLVLRGINEIYLHNS